MRKFGVRSARPTTDEGFLPASDDAQESLFRREWRLITLLAIMIVAFVIRFIFAYGVSAGSDFALSGGSGASSHLHTIESILNGTFAFTDTAFNYPVGSVNVFPAFMDFILSGVAGVVSLFGVSSGTAAAGTLAFSAPIFAALTCWPVYLIGRKMFNDEKTGLLAAILYAFFALIVMTTVFSNGTEYAFVGFLFAFMVYFLLKAMEGCDKTQLGGFKAVWGDKKIRKNVLIAGILFAMIAMSWNQFRIILLMMIFFMIAQALADRFRSKDVALTVGVYSAVILLGVLISAPLYVVSGLWDLVFSGPFILALIAVALMLFFSMTVNRSWVLMLPVTIIIAAAIFVVLYFVSGDLFSAVIGGNELYSNPLISEMAATSRHTTISSMAAFFGWVTLWLPLAMFAYMLYKYRKNAESRKYTFIMWWLLMMFCIGWYSSSYAVIAGAGFAVGSAALILKVLRAADIKGYVSGMRGNGVKHALRKSLKPIQLFTVVAVAGLIVVPNVAFAIDAATPSNSNNGDGYFGGGLGYTIMTDDSSDLTKLWSSYENKNKTGALVTWTGNSFSAVADGKFDSVTDAFGGGAAMMAYLFLADSSAKATAAMIIRLILSGNLENFRSAITSAGLNYNTIKGYVDDPSTAVEEVEANPTTYPGLSSNVTEENALYLALGNYITNSLTNFEVDSFYDDVRSASGESISYVSVDRSMLPIAYGDGSLFSSIAFLGNYSFSSMYGEPSYFYTYNTNTGYAVYSDAMYDTFFWRAYIGMSPAAAGFSGSIDYLNALGLSDGTTKANPGFGMPGYKVAYWTVMYNPSDSATGASDGWERMDAYEAIALQDAQGGMINYIASVVMLEYDPDNWSPFEGRVNYASSSGNTGAAGIRVAVFEKAEYSTTGTVEYVQRSTAFTNADGSYEIMVPDDKDYYVTFSSGSNAMTGGFIMSTYEDTFSIPTVINLAATSLSGSVVINSNPYTEDSYVIIEGTASKFRAQTNVIGGTYTFNNIVPDLYTVTVYTAAGTEINKASIPVNIGNNVGARISATSAVITVTVTDQFGKSVNSPSSTVVAMNNSTGAVFTAPIENGQAKISAIPGTYTMYVSGGGLVSASNPSVTVESTSGKSATLVAYNARSISVTGAPAGSLVSVMSFGFMYSSASSGNFAVPVSGGNNGMYTAYAVSGNTVYYGASSGPAIALSSYAGYDVKGTLKDANGEVTAGTVAFITSTGATLIFTANEKGEFNVKLPAGSYTMYAYNSSTNALLKTVNISSDTNLGDQKMETARTHTISINYSTNMSTGSTKGLAFVDVKMEMTMDGVTYELVTKTDTTGAAVFKVPSGYSAELTTEAINNAMFSMESRSTTAAAGTGNTSNTWRLTAKENPDSTNFVKLVPVTSSVPVDITLYNNSATKYNVSSSPVSVVPGQYTALIEGTNGQYFSGTVHIYPGQSGSLNIDTTNVATVTINASASDKITVTSTDEGKYFVDSDNKLIYYFERGHDFYVTATSGTGDSETIAYANVDNISGNMTLDLSNKAAKAVIKGYVGAVANGTVEVRYDSVKVPFSVSNGSFEITVPTGKALSLTADVTITSGTDTYKLHGSTTMTASEVTDGARCNFPVTTSGTDTDSALSGSNFNFSNGHGTFQLSVKNNEKFAQTYVVSAGPAWILDTTYTVTVGAESTGNVTVSGTYDATRIGAGNEDLNVSVRSINGTDAGKYVLPGSIFSSSSTTNMYVDIGGTEGAFADAVNGHEYMFAVTITNNDNYLKSVTLNVTMNGSPSNWTLVLSDANGREIKNTGGTYSINAFGATLVYVKVMCRDSSSTTVPTISVAVSASSNLFTNSSGVTVTGNTATFSMSAQQAEMDASDMTATGDGVHKERSSIPIATMVLAALTVLAFILMLWLGIKKGVFVRRR